MRSALNVKYTLNFKDLVWNKIPLKVFYTDYVVLKYFEYFGLKYIMKINLTYFFLLFNVDIRKLKITYVACTIFLLGSTDLQDMCWALFLYIHLQKLKIVIVSYLLFYNLIFHLMKYQDHFLMLLNVFLWHHFKLLSSILSHWT